MIPTPSPSPKITKKRESWLGVSVTALCCAGFLWWWFSLPSTPEPVGILGLVDRAVAEAETAGKADEPALQLDLFELAMLRLRHAGQAEAEGIASKISDPAVLDHFWQEAALATFNQPGGDYSPALRTCERIREPALRQRTHQAVVAEMALLGMADGAVLLATKDPALQAKLARVFSESALQEKAAALLPALENQENLPPAAQLDLAWTHLWLRQWEKVAARLPQLPPAAQDDLWSDYFRATRLERPTEAAAVLAQVPPHLQLPLRLEAASQVQDSVQSPVALLQELKASAEKNNQAAEWLQLAQACWKLQIESVIPWHTAATNAATQASLLPALQQAALATELAGLYLDAAELAPGKEWLTRALAQALLIPAAAERFAQLTQLYEQAFRSSEPEHAQEVLTALQNTLSQIPSPGPEATALVNALIREGRWDEALAIAQQQPTRREHYLAEILARLAESTAVPFGVSQDLSMATYRQVAANQGEAAATFPALRLGPGLLRSRSWLAIAKGLSQPVK